MSAKKVLSLSDYRERLQGVATIDARLALEIIDIAEQEIEAAHGEYSLAQAMGLSGRSRSWFKRRLDSWMKQGLARQVGRVWLVKRAVIPPRKVRNARAGFELDAPTGSIADALFRESA